jgi:hypothetical protein
MVQRLSLKTASKNFLGIQHGLACKQPVLALGLFDEPESGFSIGQVTAKGNVLATVPFEPIPNGVVRVGVNFGSYWNRYPVHGEGC